MAMRRCPRADELEDLAHQLPVNEQVRRHAETCLTCSQIVSDLRCQAQLVAALREAHAEAIDERTRAEILAICQAATAPAKDQAP